MLVRDARTGVVVAHRVNLAGSFGKRLKGLMGRRSLEVGEGLLLEPCNAVHTFFLGVPLDVLFLDAGNRVLLAIPALPRRRVAYCRGARRVLELAPGSIARSGLFTGASLFFEFAHPL